MLLSARKARKISQATVASRLSLSQSRISHLEQHANEISVEQLMSWCAALGLEIAIGVRNNEAHKSKAAW